MSELEKMAEEFMQLLEKECHISGSSRRMAVEYTTDYFERVQKESLALRIEWPSYTTLEERYRTETLRELYHWLQLNIRPVGEQ